MGGRAKRKPASHTGLPKFVGPEAVLGQELNLILVLFFVETCNLNVSNIGYIFE